MKSDTELIINENKFKNLIRTADGDVRIIWILIIIPIIILGVLLSSRIIFVLIARQIFLADGLTQQIALENAQNLMMSAEWQAFLGAIDLILVIFVVYLLITKIDKRDFRWSNLGLRFDSTSIPYLILGTLVSILFMLTVNGVGLLVGTLELQSLTSEEIFTPANIKFMILFYIWTIFNGFWQEILFRGYLQNKVVEKHNVKIGITMVTIYFVLVHF